MTTTKKFHEDCPVCKTPVLVHRKIWPDGSYVQYDPYIPQVDGTLYCPECLDGYTYNEEDDEPELSWKDEARALTYPVMDKHCECDYRELADNTDHEEWKCVKCGRLFDRESDYYDRSLFVGDDTYETSLTETTCDDCGGPMVRSDGGGVWSSVLCVCNKCAPNQK